MGNVGHKKRVPDLPGYTGQQLLGPLNLYYYNP
jgi:hypothetical protein